MPADDYSGNFQPLRQRLLAETSGGYLRFIEGLEPRYWRVWLDISAGYLLLGLVIFLAGLPASGAGRLGASVLGAVAVGYAVAYLQLFLHEAAHQHLAQQRKLNDWLCDWLISWQTATSVRLYRPVHFAHHRQLGTTTDAENSYFRALGPRLLLETLTGVHVLRILLSRSRRLGSLAASGEGAGHQVPVLLRGALLHALVAGTAWTISGWPGLVAWVLGTGMFFPVFATIRQLLEHRAPDADPAADYTQQEHGAFTRMFGRGPLASTFGGAGFNRHLLHHWEPQVSCTRLGDLEHYLSGTSAGPVIAARRSSYGQTFARLWRARGGRTGSGHAA